MASPRLVRPELAPDFVKEVTEEPRMPPYDDLLFVPPARSHGSSSAIRIASKASGTCRC